MRAGRETQQGEVPFGAAEKDELVPHDGLIEWRSAGFSECRVFRSLYIQYNSHTLSRLVHSKLASYLRVRISKRDAIEVLNRVLHANQVVRVEVGRQLCRRAR